MQMPQEIRDRFDADDIPPQAYALVGAALALRQRAAAVLQAAGRVTALPGEVRRLPDHVRSNYASLAQEGERAVAHWHAERLLNERADRITRAMTPKAARATVSARDAARRAADSPTGQRLGDAGRRARRSAGQAWRDYLATVEETGAGQWGDAAVNGVAGPSALR